MYARKHLETLCKLCKCCGQKRNHLLKNCGKDEIYAICECAENVLTGRIPLTEQQKQRLKRHRTALLKIANTNINWKKKRNSLQTGSGVLTALLGVAVPALISLFSR